MGIPILTEPTADGRFRALTGGPLSMEAEAATREAARRQLEMLIEQRLQSGTEVEELVLNGSSINSSHPLARFVGDMSEDPLLDPWLAAIEEHRKQKDLEAGI